jgi:uncharacterized protein YaaR (DUF327 family)
MSKATASKPKVKKPKASDEARLARLVEDVIDKGANTAEEINRAILNLPVTVLENLGLGDTAEHVKKVQDSSIGAIYTLIRDINHKVADLATELLDKKRAKRQ